MNQTHPQESRRISKDLYWTMMPKTTRKFSENMVRRRKPFLGSENCPYPSSPLPTSRNNSKHIKEQVQYNNEVKYSLNSLDGIHQNNNFKAENGAKLDFVPNYLKTRPPLSPCENIQATRMKAEHVFNSDKEMENWWRIKNDIKKLTKTDKYIRKTNEGQLGTTDLQYSESERKLESSTTNLAKCMKIQIGISTTEIKTTNDSDISQISGYYSEGSINETSSFFESETSMENFIYHGEPKPLTNSTFIYEKETRDSNEVSHFTKNIPIPLIIINEIDIIDKNFKKKGTEMANFNSLKVPVVPKLSEYGQNEGLQMKLNQNELFERTEVKDKVMRQLLEMAQSTDFPKLKHLCNKECEKDNDGFCKIIKKPAEDNAKQQEQHNSGFFQYMWRAIKYRFVSNSTITDKKAEVLKMESNVEKVENRNQETEVSKEENKDEREFEFIQLEEGKPKPIETEKCKQEKLIEIFDDTEVGKEKKDFEHDTVNLQKTKSAEVQKSTVEQMDNNFRTNEDEKAIDLINETKIDKTTEKDNFKLTNQNNANNEEITVENEAKNDEKENSNGTFQKKNEVKSKFKQRLFLIFSRSNKTENGKDKAEEKFKETSKVDRNINERMEKNLAEIEKPENKISEEALKKLENFMALKNKQQTTDLKANSKRSGSF